MTTQTPDAATTPMPARTAPDRRFTPRNAVRLASAAILFLNSEHDGLSDRPLPLATASEDGLQSVLRLLEPAAA